MLRLPGFKSQSITDYIGTTPVFDIRTHLNGPLISEGMIYGPTGKVISRFVADMHGSWSGATGLCKRNSSTRVACVRIASGV